MSLYLLLVCSQYKYGGVYADIDRWPEDAFHETNIPTNVSGFFYSDAWDRPSQWFMAFEPNHPMMYLTMEKIVKNLLQFYTIGTKPKLVFLTGPHVVFHAYREFLEHANVTFDAYRNLKMNSKNRDVGTDQPRRGNILVGKHTGMSNKVILKERGAFLDNKKYYNDMVVEFNNTGPTAPTNVTITRGTRIIKESGVIHWTRQTYKSSESEGEEICAREQMKWQAYNNSNSTP